MSAAPLLLEIGCEEIPARMLEGAAADLASRIAGVLDGAGLAHGSPRPLCTLRRLAVLVPEVALRQSDREEEVMGPPAKTARGADGAWSKAALGFAQKMGVDAAALDIIATPKGDYLGMRRHVPGRAASEILCEALPRTVAGMPFPKAMRWGDGTRRFVRPVHWIVALLGAEVVPVELFGIRAGNRTAGHRVLGQKEVPVPSASEYESVLMTQGVVVDREARRRALSRRLVELAGEESVRPVENAALLEEVADLIEFPGAVLGTFPKEFLGLPREVLVTTLRHHQKAFSTQNDEGLVNRFLVVADLDSDSKGEIRRGNEWVVVGRLEDAKFFYDEDRKTPFESRTEKLAQITFHAQAGSYADKSARTGRIAAELAGTADPAVLARAARLAKCDLTTGLVGEFPELQGIAGGLYLRAQGAGAEGAAQAIYEHYRPMGAGDDIPRSPEGAVLALSDRLDTIVALGRCVGLPTGSKDPFALRRAAYSVVRIAAESPLPLSLGRMVDSAWNAFAGEAPAKGAAAAAAPTKGAAAAPVTRDQILAFLSERLEFWLKEKGRRYDTINAVLLAAGGSRAASEPIPSLVEKVAALERLRDLPDFAALAEIHKRCRNILEQAAGKGAAPPAAITVKKDAGEDEALAGLAGEVAQAESAVSAAMTRDDFEDALSRLVSLRPALTRFFDHVLVMHPDAAERDKRLGLVGKTALMIEKVADLKQIAVSREDLQKQLSRLEAN